MPDTIVNINRQIIARNNKTGSRDAPIRVSTGKYGKPHYVFSYTRLVNGNVVARVIYDPDKPLPCGAKVWLEFPND